MDLTDANRADTSPVFPRRALLAAAFSAFAAGGAVGLGLWGGLSVVHHETFQFSRGTTLANGEIERLRGFAAQALHDDRIHVAIVAHSGTAGDADANLDLSRARADTIAAIATELGVPAARITATGVGGGAPLTQEGGESDRAFQARLARVDVSLQVRQ